MRMDLLRFQKLLGLIWVDWNLFLAQNKASLSLSIINKNNNMALRGGLAEWSKAAVLKTVERLRVPGVRIPRPPPYFFR